MLLLEYAFGQRVFVVRIQHRHRLLYDDRPVIQFLVNDVNRATAHFHTIGKGLFLGLKPWKSRQKRWMNIEDSLRKLAHEPRRKQAHVASQTDQINLMFP